MDNSLLEVARSSLGCGHSSPRGSYGHLATPPSSLPVHFSLLFPLRKLRPLLGRRQAVPATLLRTRSCLMCLSFCLPHLGGRLTHVWHIGFYTFSILRELTEFCKSTSAMSDKLAVVAQRKRAVIMNYPLVLSVVYKYSPAVREVP